MRRLLATALTAAALTTNAAATVLLPADLSELTSDARAIVRGRIVSAEGRWTDDHRGIETLVTLDVDDYLKGERAGTTAQFKVPGGHVGHLRSIFIGAPQFSPGERVIVFLGARGPAIPYVLGLSEGVFRVVPAVNGGWAVTPPPILASRGTTRPIVRGDSSRRPVPLDAFERDVRALTASAAMRERRGRR